MPKLRWLRGCLALLLLHLCWQVMAASAPSGDRSFAVRVWETDDGLPDNSILSLAQTRDGYLWLGTLNGLVRFDGLTFRVLNSGNTLGLPENRILFLFEDSSRRLWIGTESAGVVYLQDGRVHSPHALSSGGPERVLRGAAEDASGAVWLMLANGDLWRFKDGVVAPFVSPGGQGAAHSLIKDRSGTLWVGMRHQQFAIGTVADPGSLELPLLSEPRTFAVLDRLVPSASGGYWRLAIATASLVQRVNGEQEQTITSPYPWPFEASAACEDLDGNLIVGTKGSGVYIVSPTGEVTRLGTAERLSHSWISSLLVDRDGTLWVGTDGGGLNRVTRQVFKPVKAIPAWSVESLTQDTNGTLYIGTSRDGLAYWRGDEARQYFGAGRSITAVRGASDGSVWFAAAPTLTKPTPELCRIANSLPERNLGGGLIEHRVQAIHEDRTDRMWFGTAGGLVVQQGGEWKRFTTREGLSGNSVTAIADDAAGTVWVGTERSGVNRFANGTFTAMRRSDGGPGDEITALLTDASDVVWVATSANGLGRFKEGRWTRFGEREGLASEKLSYLIDDASGNLWMGSAVGILRIPKSALNEFAEGRRSSIPCRVFDQNDGLPTRSSPVRTQPAAWRGTDGLLWFATTKGVAMANPVNVRINTNPPPVNIEGILVDDVARRMERSSGVTALVLNPSDERVEIQYSSLNIGAAERARFRYQLEGYEKDWFDAGRTRAAIYRKLAPGNYTFRVIAANEDGIWNEQGASLAIVVLPPFWRTWWFIATCVVVIGGLIAGIVHYLSTQKLQRQLAVLRQQEALERERARIARDIHDQVGASLTQVALLGELVETDKDLPEEVEGHAKQICQTARDTTRALDEIVWTVNPANDTLEGLVNYICKHAQDFLGVAGLRYRLEIPDVPAVNITPDVRHNVFLASKEAVTNIVRHSKGTAAWLRLRFVPDSFVVEIEDNGRGIPDPDAPSVRNGLKNMRKRLEEVGGRCEFLPGHEGGLLVRLTVPLSK